MSVKGHDEGNDVIKIDPARTAPILAEVHKAASKLADGLQQLETATTVDRQTGGTLVDQLSPQLRTHADAVEAALAQLPPEVQAVSANVLESARSLGDLPLAGYDMAEPAAGASLRAARRALNKEITRGWANLQRVDSSVVPAGRVPDELASEPAAVAARHQQEQLRGTREVMEGWISSDRSAEAGALFSLFSDRRSLNSYMGATPMGYGYGKHVDLSHPSPEDLPLVERFYETSDIPREIVSFE
jgi:hypothetical protein